jgi:hypothetical protein
MAIQELIGDPASRVLVSQFQCLSQTIAH